MIRIPIPPHLPLKEFLHLRSHADWYLRARARIHARHQAEASAPRHTRRLRKLVLMSAAPVA